MTPFATHTPWFSLSQRKKTRPGPPEPSTRYRKRKDMVSAPLPLPQPASLPLLFAADSISNVKAKTNKGPPFPSYPPPQESYLPTPERTPKTKLQQQSGQPGRGSNGAAVGRKRKPMLKLATSESDWTPPQSPFDPRPPGSGTPSPSSMQRFPLSNTPTHRASPPPRLSPRSAHTGSASSRSSQSPPVPPRPQRRVVSGGPGEYVPPPSTFSALGPRPISAFPTSSRPVAETVGKRPTSLPADTSDIYNFFLGNNVTRKRVDFHEISPKDMRDLASDQRSNKRSFIGVGPCGSEQKRKTAKPRIVTFNGTSAKQRSSASSGSPSSIDKVWFASTAASGKCS